MHSDFTPNIRIHRFDELSAAAFHDLLKLRFDVFILEQQSLYPEIDGEDKDALHLVAEDEQGAPCGTLRILGADGSGPLYIGRVAVRPDHRGTGLGRKMMNAALAHLREIAPDRAVRLGAQQHLEAFYSSFGFERISDVYDDGGIPHIDMEKAPS